MESVERKGFSELILTEDSLWFGTRGKVVVLELESGTVRADVELGVDGYVGQFALAAAGKWLWYLHEGQVGAVRLADAMVTRIAPAPPVAAAIPKPDRSP